MDPVKKELLKEKIKLILVTSDISENSLKEIQNSLNSYNKIEILQIKNTKDNINSAVGKYSAVIGISNENFAKKIKLLTGGTKTQKKDFQEMELIRRSNQEECSI